MRTPWDIVYAHPGGWDRRFAPLPVPELLRRSAAAKPDAIALDFYGRRTRYSELMEAAARAARGFQMLGLGRGSRIGLFLPNTPHYPAAYYGALLAGATVVNFSPLYSPDEVLAQARDAGISAMVCLDLARLWPPMQRLLDERAVDHVFVGNLPEVLPGLKSLGFRLLKGRERQKMPSDPRVRSWAQLTDNDGAFAPAEIDSERDIALIQYTGGTTGVPKGAALSHANLTINALQLEAIDPERPRKEGRVLGCLPLFHIFANTAILNRTVLSGGEIVLLPKFEAGEALAAIRRRRCTDLAGVPAMYQAMLDEPGLKPDTFATVQQAFSGGAAMTPALKERFEAATGARVLEGYGLTESSGVVSVNPYVGESRAGTVGHPLPGTRILILGEDGKEQSQGERGEICIAGPQIMTGYWRGAQGGVEPLAGGLLRTGDIGLIDPDGYLKIVDRLKDMINVGGFKVFPSQLEAVLTRHPAVREALVIGIADERLGERPKAFVSLMPDSAATADDLKAYLNPKIGKHERVDQLELRKELPKTVIGKPDRKALVAEEKARASAAPEALAAA